MAASEIKTRGRGEREPQELLTSNNRGSDIRAAEVDRAQGKKSLWGITAEFDDTDKLIEAARLARMQGYTRLDSYTPMPIEGCRKPSVTATNRCPR
jgi:hypothetical protein